VTLVSGQPSQPPSSVAGKETPPRVCLLRWAGTFLHSVSDRSPDRPTHSSPPSLFSSARPSLSSRSISGSGNMESSSGGCSPWPSWLSCLGSSIAFEFRARRVLSRVDRNANGQYDYSCQADPQGNACNPEAIGLVLVGIARDSDAMQTGVDQGPLVEGWVRFQGRRSRPTHHFVVLDLGPNNHWRDSPNGISGGNAERNEAGGDLGRPQRPSPGTSSFQLGKIEHDGGTCAGQRNARRDDRSRLRI
jgi:hypothetical protein